MNNEHTGPITGEISIPMDADATEIETCIFDQMVASGVPIEVAAEAAPQLAQDALRQKHQFMLAEGERQGFEQISAQLEAAYAEIESLRWLVKSVRRAAYIMAVGAAAIAGATVGYAGWFLLHR